MTSFDPIHPKTGAIIELLAEKKVLSTKELMRLLAEERGITMSPANFYKLVSKMLEHQMLVKSSDHVSINLTWATTVYKFANLMHEQIESNISAFPPFKPGERRTFNADSLDRIDPIWTHLVLYLFSQEKDENIYAYESHPWFLLGRPATERRMYESCATQGKIINMLYGNKTFLDEYGFQMLKSTSCIGAITDQPPFPKTSYNLWLCGDYIIECFFPELVDQYFDSFFRTVKSTNDFDLKTFSSIFHLKVPTQLQVTRDKKKAETLRKSFWKYFKG
jgi:hypothetical protein